MASRYDKIQTARDLVMEVKFHGFSCKPEDICRAQDIFGHSTIEELDTLANDIGRNNENGEPDPKGTWSSTRTPTRDTFYSILFQIWNWEEATRFWNEHSNPEREQIAVIKIENQTQRAEIKDKEKRIPVRNIVCAPQTPVRSVFSWGHEMDDYRATFREMARARFNRIIIWNNQRVINARDVVEEAHSWGIKVFWGFAWGWSLHCDKADIHNLEKLSDNIIDEWHRIWKPMGGDGIYFQSFTETDRQEIAGRSIAEAVVELVNMTAKRIHAESPELDIVFGLHSNSIRKPGATDFIAKTDPSLEILWENCGGFPFWEGNGRTGGPDNEFCEKILALTPSVGFVWKAQLYLDWKNWIEPAGPFMLGCAGRRMREYHQSIMQPMQCSFDNDWFQNGKFAWESIRRLRAAKRPPKEFNAVPYNNPPFGLAPFCEAELFWNSDDPWEKILMRARMRALPER